MYKLNINSKDYEVSDSLDLPLLWYLRDMLDFTGAKYGCGKGLCGACTVIIEDIPVRSCLIPIKSLVGKRIITPEGLTGELVDRIKEAWLLEDVPQCGYCQNGQIMSAYGLLSQNSNPSNQEIDSHMSGNICRCGTYNRIKSAIRLSSRKGES